MGRKEFIENIEANGKEGKTWEELAKIYNIVSGNAARKIWKKYLNNKHDIYIAGVDPYGDNSKSVVSIYKKVAGYEGRPEETKEVNLDKGTLKSVIEIDFEPKDDVELAQLHKVNLDKYKISTYYSKLKSNGKFTSTVLCTAKTGEDVFEEDILNSLKEVLRSTEKYKVLKSASFKTTDKALFVYLADDHAGIDFKKSLFGNPYDGKTYAQRLLDLSEEIRNLKEDFAHLFIVNLGDELDGFNAKTTRDGHSLDSLSNKEQFNIYTTARKLFYDSLFQSGLFPTSTIININNSNHSGNDYSFIVNKALEFYLEARYENITFVNQEEFIDTYVWGDHVIALTHGKDEKYMKSPMPLNLDYKTDLWLIDYLKNTQGKYFSTIKGDLHNYSVNVGKSGRYVNVPSICGGSAWIEHNFGSSNSGALLEIVSKTNKNIKSIPIWF